MNLKALLESKIREFDASIDLSDGSRIQRTVISPVVSALSVDPLSVNTRDYLYSRFSEVFPDAPITRGNALDDILITAAEYFMLGYREELARLKNATSLENLNLLTDDEADALASNWFVARDNGANASGSVTITVDRTSSISINVSTVRFYADDIEFAPTANTVVSTDALLASGLGGGLYRFSINVRAISVGEGSNVAAGRISRVSGIPNVVSVTNSSPITGGIARDTTEFLLSNKLPRAISERSLVTARGVGARIATDIPGILRYQVIGHGDVEMLRDRVDVDSYGNLVANGHAFYMGNFALIAGYPHMSNVLTQGDELFTLSADGAPGRLTLQRVLTSQELNVLNGSDLGFTHLVELTEFVTRTAEHVSVLRPGTALLDETLVSGDVGLGGRTDVYIRSDEQQSVVGSSVLSFENNGYRGQGWLRSGNVITLTLNAPLVGDEFKRYDHVIIDGEAYTVSSIDYTSGENTVRVFVFDQDFAEASGTDYYVVSELRYNTGTSTALISPSRGGFGRLSAVIGSSAAEILDVDLLVDGVRQGDIIDIPSVGIRRSIFSVDAATRLTVDNPFQQTVSDVGARIIRPVATVVSPITELAVPGLNARHPIGVDVDTLREEQGVVASGVGNVLLPLGQKLLEQAVEQNVGTVFANYLNADGVFYRVATTGEGVNRVSRLTPNALGYARGPIGRCSVLVGESSALREDGTHPTGISEFDVWTDMFTENMNNIFVLRGDTRSSAGGLESPGASVQQGDVLRISSGYLTGDYVIESVVHNTLLCVGGNALTSVSATEPNVVAQLGESTYANITEQNEEPRFQEVTLVRIYGQFPKNPLSALAPYLNMTVTGRDLASGRIGTVDSEFFNAYINGTGDMFSSQLSADVLAEFRGSVGTALLCAGTEDIDIDLTAMFSSVLSATYDVIRPSEGIGRVRTLEGNSSVLLQRPSVQVIDVNDLIVGVQNGELRTIAYRDYTELVGSVGTYHLSATKPYYVDGSDYTRWRSSLRPITYDDRSTAASFYERFSDEYTLFDELLEPGSLGILPLKVSGISSMSAPYLRDSGTALVRYPEIDVANNVLRLSVSVAGAGLVVFPSTAFAEEETRIVPTNETTPKAYLLRLGDDSAIYGGVPPLSYVYTGTGEYDDLLTSLGDAVDGTGTPLVDIYAQHQAFFVLDTTHENSQSVLQYLVDLYGQLVTANFLREIVPSADYHVTDEFTFESLLPTSGSTFSISAPTCRPISVATLSQRSDRLEIIPSTELTTLSENLMGARIRIDYRDTVYWRRVSYTEGLNVFVDEPLPFGTPTATAYGLCIYDLDTGDIELISDPMALSGSGALSPWPEEYSTHLNTGGVNRLPDRDDIGSHITLWGYRTNEADYRSVLLNAPTTDYATEQEFLDAIMHVERETFGQFEITDVVTTFVDVVVGAEAVPSKITIRTSSRPEPTSARITSSGATKVACAFVITNPTLSIEDGLVNSVANVTMYRAEPYVYELVGISKTSPDQYLVQTRTGSLNYSYTLVEDETTDGTSVSISVLQHDDALEPTTIRAGHLVLLEDGQDITVRTTNARAAIQNQALMADGSAGIGYYMTPADLGNSFSTRDDVAIHIPCAPGPVSQTLPISGMFDPATGLAQSLVSLTSERPICADILTKSLLPVFIGLRVVYAGGPTEEEVFDALVEFIRGRILSDSTLTKSMITSLIMSMGATTVQDPIDLYLCVEDSSRRVHKRTIVDGLTDDTLFSVDATLRTTYPAISADTRLGASISVQRVSSLTNLIGNGGS